MIYKIETESDPLIEEAYEKAMTELNEFYGINWVDKRPTITIVKDRQTINRLLGRETPSWVVGFIGNINGSTIFMLDRNNYGTESDHKYDEAEYLLTIKHELSHAFYRVLSSKGSQPKWLWEGVAIYTAEQHKSKEKPGKFVDFLEFFEQGSVAGVYRESGFAVEALVNKFGKEKLLELIKATKETDTKEKFNTKFQEVYGFQPTYEEFNKIT